MMFMLTLAVTSFATLVWYSLSVLAYATDVPERANGFENKARRAGQCVLALWGATLTFLFLGA